MNDIKKIVSRFIVYGDYIAAKPFGNGHINDTYLITFNQAGKKVKYILRRINGYVFKNPELILRNTILVTKHVKKKLLLKSKKDISRKVITLIKTKSSKYFYVDANNDYWSMMFFIENAYTVDAVKTNEQAYQAAKAFGKFQKYLSDVNLSEYNITIKDFHNLSKKIEYLESTIKKNKSKRLRFCNKEILQIEKYSFIHSGYKKIKKMNLPQRLTHNDTKINNVMLDAKTNEGLCVIDLDTVMPGIVLNDFGDMVRTFISIASEEEKRIAKVKLRMNIFEHLTKGYLSEMKNILTANEKDNLILGAKIIIYEQAIRFLTDYLQGDVYYKTDYEKHNLDRAKNQLKLLYEVDKQSGKMEAIVKKYS